MKTKLLRLAVIGLTLAALGRLGVSPSGAQSSSSSSSSGGMGGCCGKQEEEKPKNCPSGSSWNDARQTCLEPNGTPRAPLN